LDKARLTLLNKKICANLLNTDNLRTIIRFAIAAGDNSCKLRFCIAANKKIGVEIGWILFILSGYGNLEVFGHGLLTVFYAQFGVNIIYMRFYGAYFDEASSGDFFI